MNKKDLEANLAHFHGTEQYFRTHPGIIVTEGVHYLAEEAECYWLIDIVWSIATSKLKGEEFVCMDLEVKEDSTATVKFTDGGKEGNNPKVLYFQAIPFTDFPLSKQRLFITETWVNGRRNKVVMLPSEY